MLYLLAGQITQYNLIFIVTGVQGI